MTHFARALGAARSGNPEAARADIAKLIELRDKLRQAKDAYWSEQVDIQSQVALAWVLYAESKYDEALKTMSAAADAEDKTEKHPVTPGVPTPARELYGTMLLEHGMAKEALAAFEATVKKEPNRLGAYVGAAKAAEKSGDAAKARQYYAKVVALAEDADGSQGRGRGCAGVHGEELDHGLNAASSDCDEEDVRIRRRRRVRLGRGRRSVRAAGGQASRPRRLGIECVPPGLDRNSVALSRRTSGAEARRSGASRLTVAARSASISAPRSGSAIARRVWQTTRTSIA